MAHEVKAPLVGVVWKIEASVDQRVEEGDTIVILESMKMEIPVEAPANGRVSRILVAEGDTVQEGQTLAEVE